MSNIRDDYPYYKPKVVPKGRKGRVEGDAIWFFLLHNVISVMIFFGFAYIIGLFDERTELLSEIFSMEFVESILIIFGLSLLAGILGRVLGYFVLRAIFNFGYKREIKKFGEFNSGLNKISFSFIITAFISSLLFGVGAITIIQWKLFDDQTFLSLLVTYFVIKLSVFFSVRLFSSMKL